MSENADDVTQSRFSGYVWLVVPLLLMGLAIAWIIAADPLKGLNRSAPPVENLTYERTVLDEAGLHLLVRAGGSEPMRIAQVQVDDAYWQFTQRPAGPIARGSTAWIDIPFPWMLGEAHFVVAVTHTGAAFDLEIPVALPTPKATWDQLVPQALVGIIVGILPVSLGLMCYPALRNAGRDLMNFLLALTIGLLAFLFVDTLLEALEFSGESAALFQGPMMVVMAAALSFLALMAVGRRSGAPTGLALSTFIAIGIGLHNLGEGLAIGAAYAAGAAGLGSFLVIGFAVHNITEGIGIVAPVLKSRPSIASLAVLALIAGGPAVIGMWLGSLAYAPHWSALALGIGAGAILQVIIEVGAYLKRTAGTGESGLFTPSILAGFLIGASFMYVTAAFVKV